MTEDQSVLGRRRIYYDQNGGEALICSDSEEEAIDEEEEKKEFVESEDYIIRFLYLKLFTLVIPINSSFLFFIPTHVHNFNFILFNNFRMTIQQLGSSDAVFVLLGQRLSIKSSKLMVRTCTPSI